MSVWIVNASPLITLAKIGQLRLLESLADELLIPQAGVTELLAGPAHDPARIAVAAEWGRRCSPSRIPEAVLEWGLGAGETAVLAAAIETPSSTAVLDDAAARSAARALGVRLIGTLGIAVRARLAGHITSAADLIAQLRDAGLRLDDTTIRVALKRVGEEWR